jgi:hypothetical protein
LPYVSRQIPFFYEELQLTRARYQLAVERYGTVNEFLGRAGSPFQFLQPRIFPQGSMALGTTCKPVYGPHDLDFVLQIEAPIGSCIRSQR